MKILLIDNYDSFTYNLYQMLGELLEKQRYLHKLDDYELKVVRNDAMSLAQIKAYNPARIILSPGAGNPDDDAYFGVGKQVILQLGQQIPILGVCLGMQGIVAAFGGEVVPSPLPMHGKVSCIAHNNTSVFAGLPSKLNVMRYHSLHAKSQTLPKCLAVTAVVGEEFNLKQPLEIMGIRHIEYPIHGLQFHPESFASEAGEELLAQFLFA